MPPYTDPTLAASGALAGDRSGGTPSRADAPNPDHLVLDPATVTLDQLPLLIALHERQGAAIALAAARLESEGGWAADGSLSMTAWLRDRCRMSATDARGLLRHGQFLRRFPTLAEAALDGTLPEAHLVALRLASCRATEGVLEPMQEAMVDALAPLPAADATRACQAWKSRAESLVPGHEPRVREQSLRFATADDGCLVGNFVLGPDAARQFEHALTTAAAPPTPGTSRARRHADALADVCAMFNANHASAGTPRHRPHVEVVIDADDLDPRRPTCPEDALLCDCVIHRVLRSGTAVLEYGRATRTVSRHLFRALAVRDQGCRFPGCDRPVSWCDAHHVVHWRHGGHTHPDNLVLLCSRHHHQVHAPGWTAALTPDGTLVIRTIDGTERRSRPPRPPREGRAGPEIVT